VGAKDGKIARFSADGLHCHELNEWRMDGFERQIDLSDFYGGKVDNICEAEKRPARMRLKKKVARRMDDFLQ
jgi:hypothetical protein